MSDISPHVADMIEQLNCMDLAGWPPAKAIMLQLANYDREVIRLRAIEGRVQSAISNLNELQRMCDGEATVYAADILRALTGED